MLETKLTQTAEDDIINLLAWSHQQFGESARERYENLLIAALSDIASHPERFGSIARFDLGRAARTWHLRGSRNRARDMAGIVHRPRHFLLYRVADARSVLVGRVLHDAMDPTLHNPGTADWAA